MCLRTAFLTHSARTTPLLRRLCRTCINLVWKRNQRTGYPVGLLKPMTHTMNFPTSSPTPHSLPSVDGPSFLALLSLKVLFVVGNHDLWTPAPPEGGVERAEEDGGSVEKLLQIHRLCEVRVWARTSQSERVESAGSRGHGSVSSSFASIIVPLHVCSALYG